MPLNNAKGSPTTDVSPHRVRAESSLTVLDLFCGAGGFSEGFRSAGFKIVAGVEKWKPAVDTFNRNFDLAIDPTDILYFENRADRIDRLPDTDVIIGSPPCVSFSYSNKLGGADKTMGLRLIRVFLSIVAVKKWKRRRCLRAWYMENVPNALSSLRPSYSFRSLGLSSWAKTNGLDPSAIAVRIHENAEIMDAVDFGVPQVRKRLFVHEIVGTRRHSSPAGGGEPKHRKRPTIGLGAVLGRLPPPTSTKGDRKIVDPLYSGISIGLDALTDHFYETGVYELYWRDSQFLKTNHPYMGAMSFPERVDKPSRTIMATPFPRSREGLLYRSEWGRTGDGEYRGPTVREAATLMSFPITYQFFGNESQKWKLIGNAVCPLVARALAMELAKRFGVAPRYVLRKHVPMDLDSLPNLNVFRPATFNDPPRRKKMSRFRRHPFKSASMTITLTNFDLASNGLADGTWRCYATYGIGAGYKIQPIDTLRLDAIRKLVEEIRPSGSDFVQHVTNGFTSRIASAPVLQALYEGSVGINDYPSPLALVQEAKEIVWKFVPDDEAVEIEDKLLLRKSLPKRQLFALFAIGQVARIAASGGGQLHG